MTNKTKQLITHFYMEYIVDVRNYNSLFFFIIAFNFWWSIALFVSNDLFSRSKVFTYLNFFGETSIAIYMLSMVILFCYFLYLKCTKILQKLCLINMTIWLFIAYLFILSNPLTTASGVYLIIGLMNGVGYLRLKERWTQ